MLLVKHSKPLAPFRRTSLPHKATQGRQRFQSRHFSSAEAEKGIEVGKTGEFKWDTDFKVKYPISFSSAKARRRTDRRSPISRRFDEDDEEVELEKLPRNTVKIEPLGRSRLSTEFLEQLLPHSEFKNPTFTFDEDVARHAYVSFANAELAFKAAEHIKRWIAENNETSDVRIRSSLVKETLQPKYSITEEELQALPSIQPPENIIVVAEEDDVDEALKTLLKGKTLDKITEKDQLILGFGVKWHGLSSFLRLERPKLCLIQLASEDTAVLFRIRKLGGIPSQVADLLANKNIKKVGSGVVSDSKVLFSLYDVNVEGVKDIHHVPAALRSQPNTFPGLVGIFLGQRILERDIRAMQLSNWQTSKDYTPQQVNFAAIDAFYGRELYVKLLNSPVDFTLTHA